MVSFPWRKDGTCHISPWSRFSAFLSMSMSTGMESAPLRALMENKAASCRMRFRLAMRYGSPRGGVSRIVISTRLEIRVQPSCKRKTWWRWTAMVCRLPRFCRVTPRISLGRIRSEYLCFEVGPARVGRVIWGRSKSFLHSVGVSIFKELVRKGTACAW